MSVPVDYRTPATADGRRNLWAWVATAFCVATVACLILGIGQSLSTFYFDRPNHLMWRTITTVINVVVSSAGTGCGIMAVVSQGRRVFSWVSLSLNASLAAFIIWDAINLVEQLYL